MYSDKITRSPLALNFGNEYNFAATKEQDVDEPDAKKFRGVLDSYFARVATESIPCSPQSKEEEKRKVEEEKNNKGTGEGNIINKQQWKTLKEKENTETTTKQQKQAKTKKEDETQENRKEEEENKRKKEEEDTQNKEEEGLKPKPHPPGGQSSNGASVPWTWHSPLWLQPRGVRDVWS